MTYEQQLKTKEWYYVRDRVLQRDMHMCVKCGAGKFSVAELNVHHKYYEKGKMAWQYPDEALVTLCGKCHKAFHFVKNTSHLTELDKALSHLVITAAGMEPYSVQNYLLTHDLPEDENGEKVH